MRRTKPFVVCTEGSTIDGRSISRAQIEEMAEHYDPASYAAVVNVEHLLFLSPNADFSNHGQVISLSTREATILGEKKLQLMAVAEVSDQAAEWQEVGKKVFASAEILPNFIGRGFSYLVGLALTDRPASLGTAKMQFSVNDGRMLAASEPVDLTFEGDADFDSLPPSLKDKVKSFLTLFSKKAPIATDSVEKTLFSLFEATTTKLLLDTNARFVSLDERVDQGNDQIERLHARVEGLQTALASFRREVSAIDASPARPVSTGGSGTALTDC